MTGRPRRKSSSAMLYCVISVLLILGLTFFSLSVFTQATVIEVTGAVRYTQSEIIEASGFELGDNLLFLDTDLAQTRIQTLLPHIREVTITPRFPDTISIDVSESVPLATLRYRTGIVVIDSSVRVVEILTNEDQVQANLIEIRGFTPTSADLGNRLRVEFTAESQLRYLEDMLKAIEEEGFRDYVTFVDIANIANITFDYKQRYRIILDNPSRIAQNMSLIRGTIEESERDGTIEPGVRGTLRVSDTRGVFNFSPDR